MGAGGRMSAIPPEDDVLRRVPHSKPPFTLGDIKKAIPPHCFRRSLLRSLSYVAYDLSIISLFYYLATSYVPLLPKPLSYLSWSVYTIFQGCALQGIWVLAHECGHHAFSDYPWLDDTVGFIIHSMLLVPYFSWKHSHRLHHSNTCSIDSDEVFVPRVKSCVTWYAKYLNHPPGRVLTIFVALTMGWPLYLLFNVSGRKYDRFASHYDPYGPIYSHRVSIKVFLSDAGVLVTTYGLYRLVAVKGLAWVFCIYGGPMIVLNCFMFLITSLNHTHPALPHYDSSEWDWLRGTLATVDRDWGILDKVFHHITDAHVVHHLFPTMPHYYAVEATNAVKPVLGDYYKFDATPIWKAIWREARECVYVEADENEQSQGVFWYANKL